MKKGKKMELVYPWLFKVKIKVICMKANLFKDFIQVMESIDGQMAIIIKEIS